MQVELVCEGWQAKCWQMLHIAVTIAFAFLFSIWTKSHHRGALLNGVTLSYCEISNKKSITALALLYWRPTGKASWFQWSVMGCRTCVELFCSCSGLGTWLDPAAFAETVVCRNRQGWAIHATGSSLGEMDISGLWGGFPNSLSRDVVLGRPLAAASEVKYAGEWNKFALFSHCCILALFHSSLSEAPSDGVVPVCIAPSFTCRPVNLAAAELSARGQPMTVRDQPDGEVPECLSNSHGSIVSGCTTNVISALKKSWPNYLIIRSESNNPPKMLLPGVSFRSWDMPLTWPLNPLCVRQANFI